MPLLNGRQLKRIFDYYCPFDDRGELKPENQRVTILAANANSPVEMFARAFAMAAAQKSGSPVIVQLSHNAILLAGSDGRAIKPIEGVQRDPRGNPATEGAILTHMAIEALAGQFDARLMSVSLDHFKVPKFEPGAAPDFDESSPAAKVAEARVKHASEYMAPVFGDDAKYDEKTLREYIKYLCSPVYLKFKQDFLGVIMAIHPAWGMIDTEKLTPLLDFVVTRDISDAVRREIGDRDVLIEAEFGATGVSGQPLDYKPVRGKELEDFAHRVARFLNYTGADGVAYPIGMEHAAKAHEKHDPDVERLKVVGGTVIRECGRYVPFVQHGGTGAAQVARGLVGKNNINTKFLVVAANNLADHVQANLAGIRAGDKDFCGVKIYNDATLAMARAAVDKLIEGGGYDVGGELEPVVFGSPASPRAAGPAAPAGGPLVGE